MGHLAGRLLNRLPRVSASRIADVLRSAVWLVPATCVAISIMLAISLIAVDAALHPSNSVLLFPGAPSGARSFLSAIVQAMISFTAVVFSITIVVLQLSSSQFSPRVLRHFLRDRTIQSSLGVFVATFVYAMVVLRAVQGGAGSGQPNFVPRIAITGAFVLVLVSVALFITYISHVTNMIRAGTIIASIGRDTRAAISRLDAGEREGAASPLCRKIACPQPGVVVSINRARLVSLAVSRDCVLRLTVRIGDFVPEAAPLFEVGSGPGASAKGREVAAGNGRRGREWDAAVCSCVAFDTERTTEQDVAFGLRQLVDIALQALSPALNAPTTAVQVIDEIHDLLRRLVTEPWPGGYYRDHAGELRLIVPHYAIDDYLRLAVEEIWHYGCRSPQIPGRLRRMLNDLHEAALTKHRPAIDAWRACVDEARF